MYNLNHLTKHNKKRKKITRNKKKKKSNLEEIKVKEFTHDDLKETQYIDEHNNIWNDMHKQIGYYDKDTDTVTLLCNFIISRTRQDLLL